MKSLWKSLSSVKLAIFLLIFITLASILGTLIPQHRSPAEYAARYGAISPLLIQLEITTLYQSFWYVGLLFLFGINTIVCTLNRISPKFSRAFKPLIKTDAQRLLSGKAAFSTESKEDVQAVKNKILKLMTKFHYRTREERDGDRISLLCRKKTSGIFGSDIVHLGILVILLGGIISGLAGDRQSLTISEGEILQVPGADFMIRLDRFETEYYPTGGVKDWKSTLTVIDKSEERLTRKIEVNHPMGYKGYMFYQQSVGYNWKNPELEIKLTMPDSPDSAETLRLHIGEKAALSEQNIEVSVTKFVPDFIIGENNQIATRSLDPNNPAAFVEGTMEGKQIISGWVFAKYPDFSQMHSNQEQPIKVELVDIHAAQYSGLQVAKDPGVNIIWIGCGLLMLGLMLAFYWPPRQIRWHLETLMDRVELTCGGSALKSPEAFQSEFNKISQSIRSAE